MRRNVYVYTCVLLKKLLNPAFQRGPKMSRKIIKLVFSYNLMYLSKRLKKADMIISYKILAIIKMLSGLNEKKREKKVHL